MEWSLGVKFGAKFGGDFGVEFVVKIEVIVFWWVFGVNGLFH